MKIIGAMLVRNEAGPDRYLAIALTRALQLCDRVIVLDDGSTDDSAALAASVDPERVIVHERGSSEGWWGREETTARSELWELASREAGPDGWILVIDADMVLDGITSSDLHALCKSTVYNSWAMPLWDCWGSAMQHRIDGYWQAWCTPRVWLAKAQPTEDFIPEWSSKTIHSGHLPHSYPVRAGIIPGLVAWRHLAYIWKNHRIAKHAQYLDLCGNQNKLGQPNDRST